MCGRYTLTVILDELIARFLIGNNTLPAYAPRYNIAPGQMVPAIISDGKQIRLGQLVWGLIPNWSKDGAAGFKMMNARAETVHEKPAFRMPFERRRCLIPADGFYEWKKQDGASAVTGKQPMRITLDQGALFAMAGLYDIWTRPDGSKVASCTILTTAPNSLMSGIHDRMPVILPRNAEMTWLDPAADPERLRALLTPYPAEQMQAYAVSRDVGNVRNEGLSLIEPISPDEQQ